MGSLKTLGNLAKERHQTTRRDILSHFAKVHAMSNVQTLEPQTVHLEAGWDDDL